MWVFMSTLGRRGGGGGGIWMSVGMSIGDIGVYGCHGCLWVSWVPMGVFMSIDKCLWVYSDKLP